MKASYPACTCLFYSIQASNSLRKEITNLRVVFDSGKHIEEQLDEALGMYRRTCCNNCMGKLRNTNKLLNL